MAKRPDYIETVWEKDKRPLTWKHRHFLVIASEPQQGYLCILCGFRAPLEYKDLDAIYEIVKPEYTFPQHLEGRLLFEDLDK